MSVRSPSAFFPSQKYLVSGSNISFFTEKCLTGKPFCKCAPWPDMINQVLQGLTPGVTGEPRNTPSSFLPDPFHALLPLPAHLSLGPPDRRAVTPTGTEKTSLPMKLKRQYPVTVHCAGCVH